MGKVVLGLQDGEMKEILLDSVGGGIVITEMDDYMNHHGRLFGAYNKSIIPPGGTLQFSFKTPLETDGIVHYRTAGLNPSVDKIDTEIWEGAVINVPGTLLQITCNNRIIDNSPPAGFELRVNSTFSNNGIKLESFSSWLPGSVGVGQSRTPQSAGASLDEVILKPNTVYRFVALNGSSLANVFASKFRFFISI